MTEIKTNICNKVTETLSLISKLKWINFNPRVTGTLDYHKVMKSHDHKTITVAGNVGLWLYPDDNERIHIQNGYIKLTTDATVTNRQIVLQYKHDATYLLFENISDTIAASLAKHILCTEHDITPDNTDADCIHVWYTPTVCNGEEFLRVYIINGQAGDSLEFNVNIESNPYGGKLN
jgi:hypothetical protein